MDDNTEQNTTIFRESLERLGLSQAQFAGLAGLPVRTIENWCQGLSRVHPLALVLLRLIEASPQVRRILGVSSGKSVRQQRGRPFRRGHQYRFGDARRKAALSTLGNEGDNPD